MSDSWFTTVNDKLEVEPPSIHIPDITLETLVGISVAIAGNVLISLALNIQKLAHLRLGRESKEAMGDSGGESGRSLPGIHRNRSTHDTATACSPGGSREVFQEHLPLETQPLIQPRSSSLPPPARYGLYHNGPSTAGDDTRSGVSTHRGRTRRRQKNSGFSSRFTSLLHLNLGSSSSGPLQESSPTLGSAAMSVGAFLRSKPQVKDTSRGQSEGDNEGDYLRSKLWWLGFILMNLGEVGNFISYAFAPASIVAPLGMFALVANCFFAPLMLKERFRSRDLLGIFLAIVGASTVVLSSPSSDGETPPLTEDELLKAISQRSFVVFSIIYLGLATVLGGLSEGPVGKRIVIVDVGLCAVFGGFTVLATKAISTLLTKEWGKMFTQWITYPILVVLLLTGALQIRYLNRALKRFDSKTVIPAQFVLFTLSAVIGSAVLYGDFRRATFHQMVTFLYGCAATFVGVFMIAWRKDDPNVDSGRDVERNQHAEEHESLLAPRDRVEHSTTVGVVPPREVPVLRSKASTISIVGYSPVQHLCFAHTPPRDRERGVGCVSGNGIRSR
ncbi:magnesium transporter NIPA-domain-containing protein [Pisolithus thermaeus]|nr:magnesium transporter NIPA-domain-containing protein [Pisolithus thermaeus]